MKKILLVVALTLALLSWPVAGSTNAAEYQTVRNDLYSSDGDITRVASCPEDYQAVSGGYRFTPEDGTGPSSMSTLRDEPYGAFAPDMGFGWVVHVVASEAGTLYVWAVCITE